MNPPKSPTILSEREYLFMKAKGVAYLDDPRFYYVQKPGDERQPIGELLGQPVFVNCRSRIIHIGDGLSVGLDHRYIQGTTIERTAREAINQYHEHHAAAACVSPGTDASGRG